MSLIGSKKAWATIVSFGVAIGNEAFGWNLKPDELIGLLSPLMIYVVGQGVADHGKEKAKVEAKSK